MTTQANIHEAKTHFSKLLAEVARGGVVTIARAGKPIARLVPIEERPKDRKPGSAKGEVWMAPDFDDPLPEDILRAFEGEDDDLV